LSSPAAADAASSKSTTTVTASSCQTSGDEVSAPDSPKVIHYVSGLNTQCERNKIACAVATSLVHFLVPKFRASSDVSFLFSAMQFHSRVELQGSHDVSIYIDQ
jgi:hypothetical protein